MPFFISFLCLLCIDKENRNKKVASPHCTVGIQYYTPTLKCHATSWLPRLSSTFFHSVKSLCDCTFYIWSCIYFESNSKVNVDKFHPQSIYYDSKLLICCTGLNCFWPFGQNNMNSALDFYPNQPVRKQMCQIQSAKVLLFNIYFVILPVSQHVFLLGFFFVCMRVRHISNIWMRKSKLLQEITYTLHFQNNGNFLSILSIKSLQLFILRNDDLFIMRQNHKVHKKIYSNQFWPSVISSACVHIYHVK